MFQRQKNWISDVLWKPKKSHSLEQLRYLHYVLNKNSVINETNRGLLVESLRSIAEILIWGDQNDSRVFDFFLEKNILIYFNKMMNQQRFNNQICVQLLQTLSIMFENIRNQTSLYYLLSNNHVNAIIIHKFDFSDEEVLAYYISFLKTLSLKLNTQTIHFFFNERKNDFPLYTEALKFFNHSESMVRIAVRTLTLNVYRVGDNNMLEFIRDKTADPYFWNLVWFIGSHAIDLDNCARKEADHLKCDNLKGLVADHLDNLHYLHDILSLDIHDISSILTEHLLDRLLIPLYVYSTVEGRSEPEVQPRISVLVSLFLLSQILLIMNYPPLVSSLVDIILNGDEVAPGEIPEESPLPLMKAGSKTSSVASIRTFQCPEQTLEESLVAYGVNTEGYMFLGKSSMVSLSRDRPGSLQVANSKFYVKDKRKNDAGFLKEKIDDPRSTVATKLNGVAVAVTETPLAISDGDVDSLGTITSEHGDNKVAKRRNTDERPLKVPNDQCYSKMLIKVGCYIEELIKSFVRRAKDFKPDSLFFDGLRSSIDCSDNDSEALFALCLIYAAIKNKGVDKRLLHDAGISSIEDSVPYSEPLVDDVIKVFEQGCRNGSRVRTVTLEMAILVLKELVLYQKDGTIQSYLQDGHLALVENIREASTLQLRHFYKEDEIFLDMFEDEYRQMKMKPLNIVHLLMDATLLLPITGTPLTGIEFCKRLPCGEVEHTRRAIRVFLMMRELCLTLLQKKETRLPLSKVEYSVNLEDVLDLNNSDLISCTVVMEDKRVRRFLVIDEAQFILVEPDTSKLGWGVVKFVARLQDVETAPDKEDSRSLFITIHLPFAARSLTKVRTRPLLSAKFVFDDYIRCMSARQRLQRRRTMLKQNKLHSIATLLELPAMASPPAHYYTITPPDYVNLGSRKPVTPSPSHDTQSDRAGAGLRERSDAFSTISGPGECLSPNSKSRTTSQAQALARILDQSPPHGVRETRVTENAVSRVRTISVEEAEEALDMEPKNGHYPSLVRVQEQESLSDCSSSEPCSQTGSLENIPRFIKTKSHSAPPTPRGGRHPPPIDPPGLEGASLLSASPCLSDPAIYVFVPGESPPSQNVDETKNKNSAIKVGTKKAHRKKRGYAKRRSTK